MIEIRCPRCEGRAVAIEPSYEQGIKRVIDVYFENINPKWSVRCASCRYTATDVHYEDLTEPFNQVAIRGDTLWAWNQEHLFMIRDFLAGKSIKGNPYEWFATYVRGTWMRRRVLFIKEIDKFLKQNLA